MKISFVTSSLLLFYSSNCALLYIYAFSNCQGDKICNIHCQVYVITTALIADYKVSKRRGEMQRRKVFRGIIKLSYLVDWQSATGLCGSRVISAGNSAAISDVIIVIMNFYLLCNPV